MGVNLNKTGIQNLLLTIILIVGILFAASMSRGYITGAASTHQEIPEKPPATYLTASPTSGQSPFNVTLDGSQTEGAKTYNWDFGDGNTLENGSVIEVHTYSRPGVYNATLSACNDFGCSSAIVQILAENRPPIAEILLSPTSGVAPLNVSFDASESKDLDGSIASYNWNFGDNITSTEISPIHTYNISGQYTVILTVTDDLGETDIATANVSVNSPKNKPPVANAGSDVVCYVNKSCDLNGTGTDSDGSIVSYVWDFGDGATAKGASVSHIYNVTGSYTATLTVTDNDGAKASDSITVTVLKYVAPAKNKRPVPVINATPTSGLEPLLVSFSAKDSYDPDGVITSYKWDFGDGKYSENVSVNHTYKKGTYKVTLTITDNGSAVSAKSIIISVAENRTYCVKSDFKMSNIPHTDVSAIVNHIYPGSWDLYIDGNAIKAEKYGPEKPSPRKPSVIVPGWQKGYELHRKLCRRDNDWYWVTYPCALKNMTEIQNLPYFYQVWEYKRRYNIEA